MTQLTLSKTFAMSGITKDGTRVFYDIDMLSGGWPYWSTLSACGRQFPTLADIPSTAHLGQHMIEQVVSIEVLEINIQATILSTDQLIADATAKAMAEVEKIQKELAEKITSLERM